MQLDTLISPDEARAQLAHYEAQLAEERTVEDDAIRAGYRAAERGLPVISLPDAVHAGGYFPSGLPRIAIARATSTECFVRESQWGTGRQYVFSRESWDRGRAQVGRHRVEVLTPGPGQIQNQKRAFRGRTIVPTIPPQFRPRRTRLHLFHILWEVEEWTPVPPRDPALLRHLRGDLWTVHAVWDLTELERAVLSARIA
jgi:hypothetical protein